MEISDEFLSALIDDDASQLELALKYKQLEGTTPKQKKETKRPVQKKPKKQSLIPKNEWSFTCEKCNKLFPSQQRLKKHRRNAHLPAKYECSICKKQYTRIDLLKDHENTHSEEVLFECKLCKKSFKKHALLRQHERKHHEKNGQEKHGTQPLDEPSAKASAMVAETCVENVREESTETQTVELSAAQVIRAHSPKLGDNCLLNFPAADTKGNDVRNKAPDPVHLSENELEEFESFQNLADEVFLEDTPNNKEEGPFICEKCKKFFPTNKRLRKHLRNAHLSGKFRCPLCEKLFTRRDLCKDHIYTHTDEKRYHCNFKKCKKSFHMLINLKQHEKIHQRKRINSNSSDDSDGDSSDSEGNRCCSRTDCLEREPEAPRSATASPFDLQEFIEEDAAEMELAMELGTTEIVRDNEERKEGEEFICFHCFRKFTSHEDMLLHIEDEHFTFVCDICNKQYPTDKRLKKHKRDAHLSGKFRCPICDKLFTRKDLCKDHVYTHSQKPLFKCKYDNCEKTFSKPFSLKQHEKIHRNTNRRTCPICNESVVQLSKHLNRHLKTKQYPCRSCDKSFSRINYLQEHEKIHLGEKGFVCDECHLEFKSSNVLYKHKRSKHAKEKYICEVPECGQEFNRKDNMTTHMRRVHKLKVETVRSGKNDSDTDNPIETA